MTGLGYCVLPQPPADPVDPRLSNYNPNKHSAKMPAPQQSYDMLAKVSHPFKRSDPADDLQIWCAALLIEM